MSYLFDRLQFSNLYEDDAYSVTGPPYSFAGWVYPTLESQYQYLFYAAHSGGSIEVQAVNTSPLQVYAKCAVGGTVGEVNTHGTTLTLNAWNHIAVVIDTTTFRVYVNGVASSDVAHGTWSGNVTGFYMSNSWNSANAFKGYIAEVITCKALLTQQNITDLQTTYPENVTGLPTRYSHWKLNSLNDEVGGFTLQTQDSGIYPKLETGVNPTLGTGVSEDATKIYMRHRV